MLLDKTSQFANSCTPWMLDPPYTVCQDVQWCMWFEHWMVSTNLPARMHVLPLYDTRVPRFLDLSSSYHSTVSLRAGPPTKMWSVPELLPNLWISHEYPAITMGQWVCTWCCGWERHLETVVPTAPEAQMLAVFPLSLARLEIVTWIGTTEAGGCVACLKGTKASAAKKCRRSDAYWYSMLRLMLLLLFLTTTCFDDYRNNLFWWLWTTQAFPIVASVAVQHMASQLWIPSTFLSPKDLRFTSMRYPKLVHPHLDHWWFRRCVNIDMEQGRGFYRGAKHEKHGKGMESVCCCHSVWLLVQIPVTGRSPSPMSPGTKLEA